MTGLSVRELEQRIQDKKMEDANKFKDDAWNLALTILDDLDSNEVDRYYNQEIKAKWDQMAASERTQVMKFYLDNVYDKIRWALQDAIKTIGEAADASEGEDER